MPLLVGVGIKRHAQSSGDSTPLPLPRQEAGHIGALHRPGAGGRPHGPNIFQPPLLRQLLQQAGQPLYMLKQGITLSEPQFAGAHIQKAAPILP